MKGRLGLVVKDEVWAADLPFSVLDLLDILEILVKKDDFRSKRLGLDLINLET